MDDDPQGAPDAFDSALDDGIRRLQDARLGLPARVITPVLLRALKERDREKALTAVENLRRDLASVDAVLADVLERGLREQREQARARPFGPAWMSQLRRAVRQDASPQARLLEAWTDALTASAWDTCEAIARLVRDRADDGPADQLDWVAGCLRDDVPVAALPVLRTLLTRGDLPLRTEITLLVLGSRTARRFAHRLEEAARLAERAVERSAEGIWPMRSLALAALAEVRMDAGLRREAHELLERALEAEEAHPDLIVAAGRLAALAGEYGHANDYYDVAVHRFGRDVLAAPLLRELPGNLLWQAARRVRLTDPAAALDLLDRALQAGIVGGSAHPEGRVLLERAEVLEELDRAADAAGCYHDAADRYSWAESRKAVRLYDRARQLAPDVAVHHWAYGEALRASVNARHPQPSEELLRSARAALDTGFALGSPDPDTSWALVSSAVVSSQLDDGADPFLLVERALLLDPHSVRAEAFLVKLLRDRGHPLEAVEAVEAVGRAALAEVDDDLLPTQVVLALMDLGRYDEAAGIVEDRLGSRPGTAELLLLRAVLRLRQGDPRGALEALGEPSGDDVATALLRGTCHGVLGERDAERRCFQAVLDGRPDAIAEAWADYRLGHLDRAVELFGVLVAETPEVARLAEIELDLGLVLLVRGDARYDDLAVGRARLSGAVTRANHVDDLVHLLTCDVPLVREGCRTRADGPAVAEALTDFDRRARQRIAELRRQRRPASDTAVRLAAARRAATAGRHTEALDRYAAVLADGGPEETVRALLAAAEAVVRDGDRRWEAGEAGPAVHLWSRAAAGTGALPEADDLRSRARARSALAALRPDAAPADVARVLAGTDTDALDEALAVFARDLADAWGTLDLLRRALPADDRSAPVPALHLAPLYRTRRADAFDVTRQAFAGAVSLSLGALRTALDPAGFQAGIAALRDALAADLGVRLPGVRVVTDPEAAAGTARFLVYDQCVGETTVPQDAADPVAVVLEGFEAFLRENMFRWVTADDVDLWAEGWDVTPTDGAEEPWLPTEPLARYRLARVLRMLLREGVPVRDRAAILTGFREAEERDRTTPVDALGCVRPLLHPTTRGPTAGAPSDVPGSLQDRVAEGLVTGHGAAWQLPRTRAGRLVRDLRDWRATLPPGPVAVRVRDERVRLVLWRLLAADRPRVYVLAESEGP
ncbi:hypothetical protein SAMN05660359_00416 [Geodermatophilus obscurus]|uniref:Uncharacterized protein n=1 Tax=Geodermatophilus obscurus TaxID=1861 RepID=A0A1I5CMT2_9ACTN|nr:tetratricopeptide repeat protein [Geodermatophilus obscurus]SFN88309.1 hypothetical protein SAMN05660359_00416 [Geodermatophilus obscurus]